MNQNERGFSILMVVVGLAVAGLIAAGVSQLMTNRMRAQKRVEIDQDFVDLKRWIDVRASCTQTKEKLNLSACRLARTPIVMIEKNKDTLIEIPDVNKFTMVGQYQLRAFCEPCATCPGQAKLIVEAKHQSRTEDPLTRHKVDWRDIFKGIPFPCALNN